MLSAFYVAVKQAKCLPLVSESRQSDPEAYYSSLLPVCRRAKITRIADLTGLDRIGLPIVQVVRPMALSEVTSLGRGMSRFSAAIGAIMESLERYYAESIGAPRIFLSTAAELEIGAGAFTGLCSAAHRSNWRDLEIAWIRGLNMQTGAVEFIPFELVHTTFADPPPRYDGVFVRTTTGLACHRSPIDALVHGLLECVERDAIARAFQSHGFMDRMRLSTTETAPEIQAILSRIAEFGISAAFWYAPSPAKIPVVWCQTIEAGVGEPILCLPTEGYCAGLDLRQATMGALLEALAARAGAISGARDDQTRRHYARPSKDLLAQARDMILGDFSPLPANNVKMLTPVTDLSDLLSRIVAAGLGPVLAVPIASETSPDVHCVRTILAGMLSFAIER